MISVRGKRVLDVVRYVFDQNHRLIISHCTTPASSSLRSSSEEGTQSTLSTDTNSDILLGIRILNRWWDVWRDQVYTSSTDHTGRVPPVMSWHQGSIVVFIASARTHAPAGGSSGRSITQTRGGGCSHSKVVHVWNFKSNLIGGIIVITFVLVDRSMERGEVAECL